MPIILGEAAPPAITFRMETLRRQSGTTRALKLFAYDLRQIAEQQPLPEYSLKLERNGPIERVTLYRDLQKPGRPRRRSPPGLSVVSTSFRSPLPKTAPSLR